jgi:hypothetical protein
MTKLPFGGGPNSMGFIILLYNYESQPSGLLPYTHEARTGGSGTIPYYETHGLKKFGYTPNGIRSSDFGHLTDAHPFCVM